MPSTSTVHDLHCSRAQPSLVALSLRSLRNAKIHEAGVRRDVVIPSFDPSRVPGPVGAVSAPSPSDGRPSADQSWRTTWKRTYRSSTCTSLIATGSPATL